MKDILIFLLFLCIWPGSMFLVGIIGESRILPIDSHQSQTFWPGELALPVMAFVLYQDYARGFQFPRWGWILFAVLTVIWLPIGIKLWKDDLSWYKPRAKYSPTKIWHNLGGFILIPPAIVPYAITVIVEAIRGRYEISWVGVAVFVSAVSFYAVLASTDKVKHEGDEDIRHPADWQPIWVTRKIKRST